MTGTVLVIVEHIAGNLTRHSREVIAAARQLAPTRLSVGILGPDSRNCLAEPFISNTDQAYLLEHTLLAQYSPDAYVVALQHLIEQSHPELVLLPHSYQVRDYAPKLAARFQHSLISDCIAFDNIHSGTAFIRQVFQGRANARVTAHGKPPHFVTLQSGCFDTKSNTASAARPEVISLDIPLSLDQVRMQVGDPYRNAPQAVDLSQADVIIAVGRGIKSSENIAMVRRLADLLGAELAATRAVCDEGWLPIDRQVGSSGQMVSARLYIAIGISGAIQHVVGMKSSETIVAINKDASAPIFKIADYGIVGDLFEIVPALIDVLETRKAV